MQRRMLFGGLLGGLLAAGAPALCGVAVLPPSWREICVSQPSAPGMWAVLVPAFEDCVQAAQRFLAETQSRLARSEPGLADGLRLALETEAVCAAVLSLASLQSRFTGALAVRALDVLHASLQMTRRHPGLPADVRAFAQACAAAVAAVKRVA